MARTSFRGFKYILAPSYVGQRHSSARLLRTLSRFETLALTRHVMNTHLNQKQKPVSSALVVSILSIVACAATLLAVYSMENSMTSKERLPNDNPFPSLLNKGLGFFQIIVFMIGGTITGTLAMVGSGLAIAGSSNNESYGKRLGLWLSLASVISLISYAAFNAFPR